MNRSRITGNLTSHGILYSDIANDRVGIGSTIPGNKLSLPDSAKIGLGNAEDLTVVHDGNNSTISNSTGGLYLQSDTNINIDSKTGSNQYIHCQKGAEVSLWHNNSKKLETTSSGITVTGTQALTLPDAHSQGITLNQSLSRSTRILSDTARSGASQGLLSIVSNWSGTTVAKINTSTIGSTSSKGAEINFLTAVSGGSITERLTITAGGNVQIPNDTGKLQIGASQDLEIYHNGSHSFIDRRAGGTGDIYMRLGTDNALIAKTDAAVELYWDNAKKLETTSSGSTLSGDLLLDSANAEINLKAGVGSNTGAINWTFNTTGTDYSSVKLPYATRATDGLIVDGGSYNVSIKHATHYLAKLIGDGAVELYHNNSKKFETTSTGATVTGTCTATTFSGSGASLTNVNATTLDSIDSGSFLRSDASDTMSGILNLTSSSQYPLTINGSHSGKIVLQGASSPYIRFREGSTDKAYIQWDSSVNPGELIFVNQESADYLKLGSGGNGLKYFYDGSTATLWHSGNDGSGSGLDADTLDAIEGVTFARRDQANTFTSTTEEKIVLAGSSNPYIRFQEGTTNKAYIQWHSDGYLQLRNAEDGSGIRIRDDIRFTTDDFSSTNNKIWHEGNDGSGSGLDADTLDGVQGASYLRSDANDTTTGVLTINTSSAYALTLNGSNDGKLLLNGTDPYLRFQEGGTNKAYIQWNANGYIEIHNQETSESLKISSGSNGLIFREGSNDRTVWHAGNDGAGSGLDADTLDGVQGSNFLRSDQADTIAGNLTVGTGTASYIYMVDSDHGNRSIHCNSHRIGFLKDDGNWGVYCADNGAFTCENGLTVNGGNASTITMGDADEGSRQIHNNSDNIGFLTAAGNWAARCNDAGQWQCLQGLNVTGNVDIDGNTTYAAGHYISRADNKSGFFCGLHGAGSNNDTHSNPIYTIGPNYNPALTTIANMYGIGYSHGNASFTPTSASWGLYVAAAGNSTIYLDAGQSKVYIGSAGNRNISQATGDYGTFQCNASGIGGYQGWSIDGRVLLMHDGSNIAGIYNDVDNEWLLRCDLNGASAMYHDGAAKVTTDASGAVISGRIYSNTGTSTINNLTFTLNSQHTQQGRFTTATSAQTATNASDLAGTPGTLSYAYGYQEASSTTNGGWSSPFPNMVFGFHTGVQIGGHTSYGGTRFYNDHPSRTSTKLFTIGDGDNNVRSHGNLFPAVNNSIDLGSNALRWRVIYTNDLELSNKGSQNKVDGTWGDWTLQEGEDNIYMINNRSGKKFKINMTEVS